MVRLSFFILILGKTQQVHFNPKSGSIKFCGFGLPKIGIKDFNPKSGSIKFSTASLNGSALSNFNPKSGSIKLRFFNY